MTRLGQFRCFFRPSLAFACLLLLPTFLFGGTHTWTGAVSSFWSDNANWIGGTPAGDPVADLVFPSTTRLISTDDIVGVTFLNSIRFSGSGYTLNALPGSSIALASHIFTSTAGTNLIALPIGLYSGVPHGVTAPDGANSSLLISGLISGPASDALFFNVTGTFNVTLSGNNTYSGATSVARRLGAGIARLTILGSQPNSSVGVGNGGELSGTGTIGSLDVQSRVWPGTSMPGILTVMGNASFHDVGNTLKVRLNGTNPGSQYDRLDVQGSVQLSQSSLSIELGFSPNVGDTFTILQATGTLSGHFGELDGEIFSVDCINFQIDYTSNSVVLTRVAGGGPPLTDVTIAETGSRTVCTNSTGGNVDVTDSGGCANTHQWGFRTTSGGAVTPIPGETGTAYTIDGSDFPGTGTFYLVETTTPGFGAAMTSNELTITVVPPPTAVASGSATICSGSSTVLSGSGASMCSWTPVTGLSDPNSCSPVATPGTTTTYSLTVTGSTGCTSNNSAQVTVTVDPTCQGEGPLAYYTLPPCRISDTRAPAGTYGGPPLSTGTVRVFPLVGQCGVPPGAKAVALNVTVTEPTSSGFLTLYPADESLPLASSINYSPGQTRANNATALLSVDGNLAIFCGGAAGTVEAILDVSGYFQ